VHRTVKNSIGTTCSWLRLPVTLLVIFRSLHPFAAVLSRNVFISSYMRALLFACDILGALSICTFFFSVSGAKSWKSDPDACDSTGIWESIGRLAAIGMVSVFCASIPVGMLGALHSRGFEQLDPASRRKKLRAWRCQDTTIYIVGALYASFCILFVLLFIASVQEADQKSWLTSILISLAQDFLLLPLASALAPLVGGLALLSLISLRTGLGRAELCARLLGPRLNLREGLAFV